MNMQQSGRISKQRRRVNDCTEQDDKKGEWLRFGKN